jgi:4,5-dihydroxyphthalate decarboxylase
MVETKHLRVAVWRYDRTQALHDGRVGIDGYSTTVIEEPLEEMFAKAFGSAEYEVSELSFSNYLRMCVDGHCAYRGIPIFPSRSFRHGAFYVRSGSDIRQPTDLLGRRIGVREFSMTAALAARGALRDQFGFESNQVSWVVGDVDAREREQIPLPRLFRELSMEVAKDGALLDEMLLAGEIDAILAYKPPKSALARNPGSRRLFDEAEATEKAYFAQTGIFPIMHLMGVRTDKVNADARLPLSVYRAFASAQEIANADLTYEQALRIGLPWLRFELGRTIATMGTDFWPCGFAANRRVLEAMIVWSFKDGLISRLVEPERLFHESVLST